MASILILQGPNLNLLGLREPYLYGHDTLPVLHLKIVTLAKELGHEAFTFQSNAESALIDRIHQDDSDFLIINPAALTHTSIALRDALIAVTKPFIEVHLSNIHRREAFRQVSYFSDIALGTITGLGTEGYLVAVRYAHYYLTNLTKQKGSYHYGSAQDSRAH
ncbi:MAG: 3-dehydroquinate dehydratase [Gammaproteobacteria bacterium]|jgi:3-dehydroquinate dehydratase-2|nr:3-dehydroquinate dehydratase [Gammaproteobacteria bacterium]